MSKQLITGWRGKGKGLGSGGAAIPSDLPGLVAWYKSGALQTTAAGQISAWGDSTGSLDPNHVLDGPGGANNPNFIASDAAYNNKATVAFNALLAQFMFSPAAWAVPIPAPATIAFVGEISNTAVPGFFFDDFTLIEAFSFWGYTLNTVQLASPFAENSNAVPPPAGPHVYVCTFGPQGTVYVDGAPLEPFNGISDFTGAILTGLTVGAFAVSVGAADFLEGKIADFAVYNRQLNLVDIGRLTRGYGAEFGIVVP